MATYGGQDYTNFRAVNLRGSVTLRLQADAAAGTLIADLGEGLDRAWTLPNKSGKLGIMGTFLVQMPAITGGNWSETSVTVSGIRTEDALVCTLLDTFNTVTTERPQAFLAGARPANGGVHLTFMNPSGTATIPNELIVAYAASR